MNDGMGFLSKKCQNVQNFGGNDVGFGQLPGISQIVASIHVNVGRGKGKRAKEILI